MYISQQASILGIAMHDALGALRDDSTLPELLDIGIRKKVIIILR
jgi:hypothetical protein